jgi:hypothetical protein
MIRIFQKSSTGNGIKHVFSSRNDGICEINKRRLTLSFQTRNSFKSLKILAMIKRAFGVDLTTIIPWRIGICFRELDGTEMIFVAVCGLRNGGSKSRFHNGVPNSGGAQWT